MQNLLMFHVEHLATQDCHEVLMFHVEHISSPSETYHDHADRSFTFNPWVDHFDTSPFDMKHLSS